MSKGPTRAQIVDEFGEAARQMLLWRPPAAPINPHAARHAELQAQILSWHADLAGELGAVVKGRLYQVAVSARGFQSIVTPAARRAAFRFIESAGKSDPFDFFSVSIADVKAQCGKAFVEQNIPRTQTGPRTVTAAATSKAKAKAA